jgi:hypothetical protein
VEAVSALQMPRHNHPGYGWLAVGVLVAVADVTGERTMSDTFRMAARHPVIGPAVIAGWGVLTAHLFGLVPPQYDPIHRGFSLLMKRDPYAGIR